MFKKTLIILEKLKLLLQIQRKEILNQVFSQSMFNSKSKIKVVSSLSSLVKDEDSFGNSLKPTQKREGLALISDTLGKE
jgi:F0F1-type ATP synthase delta subunit